jgi:acyl-coenzyme A synthetase/AMP-(fatty) acid ligase
VLPVADALPQPVYSTRDDQPIPAAEWTRAVTGLPPLAAPRHITWDEFPRTGSWKIRRVQLREELLPDSRTMGAGRWT